MQTQGTYATQGTSARPQIGCPNAMQRASARWTPKRNARHVRKLGAPTQRKARPQVGRPNTRPHKLKAKLGAPTSQGTMGAPTQRKAHSQDGNKQHKTCPQVGRPNATQGMCTSWVPQRRSTTQTQGTSARPQDGRPNATQGTSARWSPKRKTHPQRKRPHKGALG
jgi:hypothetical protein